MWWVFKDDFYCIFAVESAGERILKMGKGPSIKDACTDGERGFRAIADKGRGI